MEDGEEEDEGPDFVGWLRPAEPSWENVAPSELAQGLRDDRRRRDLI